MRPLVIELQHDAMKNETSITELLRKAYVVSKKLKIPDFEQWIKLELDGYPHDSDIPEYRTAKGSVEYFNPYRGWKPITFGDSKDEEYFSVRKVTQRIAEIESLLSETPKDRGHLQIPFTAEEQNTLCEGMGERFQVTLMTPPTNLVRIVDGVRNIILNWSLKLEEDGILGEEMMFSKDEQQKVESHAYYVNNFYGEVSQSQIQQDSPKAKQSQVINEFSTQNVNNFISSLKNNLKDIRLASELSEELIAEISTVEIQVKSPKPKEGIIKESLKSIGRILEGASGSVVGQMLLELGKLF